MLASFILFMGFFFFLLVLISPRQDSEKRGFIPCTQEMAEGMLSCPAEGQYRCMFGHVLKNSWCDFKIVGQGFKLWFEGKQKAPWSNYIFTPKIAEDNAENAEEMQQFRQDNPNLKLELEYMKKLNQELEENNQAVPLPMPIEIMKEESNDAKTE